MARGVLSDQELVIPSWRSGDSSSTCRAGRRRRNSSLPARGESSALGPSSPPVSRYSYSARPPRSTIWDYDFSSSQGKVTETNCQDKNQKFSFVPKTESKPSASTAEIVRLSSSEGRQSRPRTRTSEQERTERKPLNLPSWQPSKVTITEIFL